MKVESSAVLFALWVTGVTSVQQKPAPQPPLSLTVKFTNHIGQLCITSSSFNSIVFRCHYNNISTRLIDSKGQVIPEDDRTKRVGPSQLDWVPLSMGDAHLVRLKLDERYMASHLSNGIYTLHVTLYRAPKADADAQRRIYPGCTIWQVKQLVAPPVRLRHADGKFSLITH